MVKIKSEKTKNELGIWEDKKVRKKHLSKRFMCFSLVGLLLAGNVQTVLATDAAPAKQTETVWIDESVKTDLDAAEAAAKKAEEAAKAADTAADAVQKVEEAVYTTEVISGNTVDELITEAEDEVKDVTTSGNAIDKAVEISVSANEYISANEAAITTSANEAVVEVKKDTVSANEASAKASTAEDKAAQALLAAQKATNGTEAQAAADLAKAAYVEAKVASDEAASFYLSAVTKLDAAQKALDAALLLVSENVADYEETLKSAIAEAEAALTEAKNAVELARAEYDKAVDNTVNVADKAAEALKLSGDANAAAAMVAEASNRIDTEVKAPVEADIEAAKNTVEAKVAAEKAAKEAATKITEEQKKIIAAQEAEKAAALAAKSEVVKKIKEYTDADSTITSLEYTSVFGPWTSAIDKAEKTVREGLGYTETYTKWVWDGWDSGFRDFTRWVQLHTQAELNAANATIRTYESAQAVKASIDINKEKTASATADSRIKSADNAVQTANGKIAVATQAATKASNDLTTAKNTQAELELNLKSFTYENEGTPISFSDVTPTEQKLFDEMIASSNQYNEITNDVNSYQWATADESFWDTLGGLFTGKTWEKLSNEFGIETKYHGWTTQNGTYIIIQNDKDNTEALLIIKGDKASILEKEQGEFASYAAAYDKVAAAQAATKAAESAKIAADAAKNVADAEARLVAAENALAAAKAKLETAKINKLNVELAKAELSKAEDAVGTASNDVELAKEEESKANEEYLAAQKIADSFKVTTNNNDNNTSTTTPTVSKNTVTISDNQTALAVAPVAPAPARTTGNTRQATRTTTEIADEEVAQAPAVEETDDVVVEEADDTTVIADEDTAKAATMEENTFAWWWILVIIAAAVAGFVGYRYNKAKKVVKPVSVNKTEK